MSTAIGRTIVGTIDLIGQGIEIGCKKKPLPVFESNGSKIKKFTPLIELNFSSSSQFNSLALVQLITKIRDYSKLPIMIIDLRKEAHGFLNTLAFSWINQSANDTLDYEKEAALLSKLSKKRTVLIFSKKGDLRTKSVQEIKSEQHIVSSFEDVSYRRLPIVDLMHPSDEQVDEFIKLIRSCQSTNWIHVHCKKGKNRSLIMRVMCDMVLNAKTSSLNAFFSKHDLDTYFCRHEESSFRGEINHKNKKFLEEFYTFCKNGLETMTWQDWVKTKM